MLGSVLLTAHVKSSMMFNSHNLHKLSLDLEFEFDIKYRGYVTGEYNLALSDLCRCIM